jgi:hypothetical protein
VDTLRPGDFPKAIPIEALFDEGRGPNLHADPRRMLCEANVIFVVDVMSQQRVLVYGKDFLESVRKNNVSVPGVIIAIELDIDTDEWIKLLALVRAIKGHDDVYTAKGEVQ